MKPFRPFCLAVLTLAAGPVLAQDDPHPFDVGDLLAMERVSDPQVSPDGKWIAYTLRTSDLEANRGRTDLWLVGVDGSGSRRLTTDPAGDWNGRWMPDGQSLVFLSTRGGSSQVWQLPIAGGEAQALTELQLDVGNLAVFPDGKRLLFTIDVRPDATTLEESVELEKERAKEMGQARLYESLLHRHWDSIEDGLRSHVFVWEIGGGAPRDLMAGLDVDSPTRPFGGGEEIAISPDGAEVVFAAKSVGRQAAWSTNVDLFRVPADGSSAPRNITKENRAYDNSPSFSPDGRWLAYLAMARPGFEADRLRIVLVDRGNGERRSLVEDWDRSAGGITWSADSRTIYTTASHLGNRSLFAIDTVADQARLLVEKGTQSSPAPAGGRVVYAHDDLRSPVELWSVKPDGTDARPVTHVNDRRVAAIQWGAYEQFTFPGWNDETVHGYVMRPAGFEEGRSYPVAFLIHGGPQGSFGDHFHYRWNPQTYAGAGYAAVFIDFHGSTGYGQAFTDSISNDWGGKPYEDLMKGLDFALERYPFLDGERVVALGASYGGYMINWIAGQTDRFRALVNHDGVFDTRSMYYETEELWFPEWENEGTPWDKPENYARHNPAEYVLFWDTPMLVIHGALDFRVPETQGFAAFTALQRKGLASKLLYFPDENHWVLKPKNSILWHDTVRAWLDEWTAAGN